MTTDSTLTPRGWWATLRRLTPDYPTRIAQLERQLTQADWLIEALRAGSPNDADLEENVLLHEFVIFACHRDPELIPYLDARLRVEVMR